MSWNVKWVYDLKPKHPELHTSERTIVPRTVIFLWSCQLPWKYWNQVLSGLVSSRCQNWNNAPIVIQFLVENHNRNYTYKEGMSIPPEKGENFTNSMSNFFFSTHKVEAHCRLQSTSAAPSPSLSVLTCSRKNQPGYISLLKQIPKSVEHLVEGTKNKTEICPMMR